LTGFRLGETYGETSPKRLRRVGGLLSLRDTCVRRPDGPETGQATVPQRGKSRRGEWSRPCALPWANGD